jgi:hypothetical protein
MKTFHKLLIGLACVVGLLFIWAISPVITPAETVPTGTTQYAYRIQAQHFGIKNVASQELWYMGYANGSTAIYLVVPDSPDQAYQVATCWYESASNTWATDDVYQLLDANGNHRNDTYINGIAGIDTAGGIYYIKFEDVSGI